MDANDSERYNTPTASLFAVETRLPQAPVRGQAGTQFVENVESVSQSSSQTNSMNINTSAHRESNAQTQMMTSSSTSSRNSKSQNHSNSSLSFTNNAINSSNQPHNRDQIQRYLDEISISMKADEFAEKQEEEEYKKYIQSCLKDVENLKFTQWQLPNFHDLPNLIHKFE